MKLELKNIKKTYQNTVVLNNFSMTLSDSEIVVIKGPSGVGKTTIIRCINLLESIDDGEIILNGAVISKQRFEKKERINISVMNRIFKKLKRPKLPYFQINIGLVFQNYNLFPHMTVLENVIGAPLYHKLMSKEEAMNQARTLLQELGIKDKETAYPYQLSGGQKQRVAIARACILKPEILCFDEPTAALDLDSTNAVVSLIQNLAAKGLGILVVSHDDNFAQKIATRTITINQ